MSELKKQVINIDGQEIAPVTFSDVVFLSDGTTTVENKLFEQDNKKIGLNDLDNDVIQAITGNATITSWSNPYKANADIPLWIETYVGGYNYCLHPKVLYFPSKFASRYFVMAYSPMPTQYEDPCIATSNNGIKWFKPSFQNPVDKASDITTSIGLSGYNTDPHIVYREDTGVLELWYRYCATEGANKHEIIYRKTTTDLINWTAREEVYRVTNTDDHIHCACPSILIDNGMYKMWYRDRDGGTFYIESSLSSISWSTPQICSGLGEWHFDVIKNGLLYEYVGAGVYLNSTDGITWTNKTTTISKGKKFSWDENGVYRPSLVRVNNIPYIYYSVNSTDSIYIGLAVGDTTDITSLTGMPYSAIYKMIGKDNSPSDRTYPSLLGATWQR